MSHEELCERARRWLSGTRRCTPVFSNIASCDEIPDAIGWASAYGWRGSTLIECKTSLADFYGDWRKRHEYRKGDDHPIHAKRVTRQWASENGYSAVEIPVMGDWRFYMCEPEVIPEEALLRHAPDHGLLYVSGRRVSVIRAAQRRVLVSKDAEIRYLRFAIINGKSSYRKSKSSPLLELVSKAG
jgi:hypothetical protein